MKQLNNKGFSVVEGLLILVILGILSGVGWYVMDQNKDIEDASTNSATSQAPASTPEEYKRTTTAPDDWKTFENKEYEISLAYPANWTVKSNLIDKKEDVKTQSVFSENATKVFVVCYQEPGVTQMCSDQVNVNDQPFSQSLAQLRKYYKENNSPYTEKEFKIDGHRLVEFRSEASGGFPAEKSYYLAANDYTYSFTTVYEGEPKEGSLQELSAKDSLTLFESIKVQ